MWTCEGVYCWQQEGHPVCEKVWLSVLWNGLPFETCPNPWKTKIDGIASMCVLHIFLWELRNAFYLTGHSQSNKMHLFLVINCLYMMIIMALRLVILILSVYLLLLHWITNQRTFLWFTGILTSALSAAAAHWQWMSYWSTLNITGAFHSLWNHSCGSVFFSLV